MIKTVYIDTLDGVKDLVFEQERNQDNGRYRSSYFYRGCQDASFKLCTSLYRNCKEKAAELEPFILEYFTKYGSIQDPTIQDSVWKAMMVGQHHGLPTRLLDWTRSTVVALHFADSEERLKKMDRRDCAVWRIDARELNERLPEKYQEALREKNTFIYSADRLAKITNSLKEYDEDMGSRAFVTVEPSSIDQRIVNQYSFFSVIPNGITDIEAYLDQNTVHTVKYVIDKTLRWDIRDILDQMNINERMMYPGMDGIAKWLSRHYYVREEDKLVQ